jgi:hypothetical protein
MRRNMSIHELQARRQQRFVTWAMVALALVSAPFLVACGGGDERDGSPCGDGDACKRPIVTREQKK